MTTETVPAIPTFEECGRLIDEGRDLVGLESLIYENEPAGKDACNKFRQDVQTAIQDAYNAGKSAVLQSPEVQQALQDKARIDWIESCFGADLTRLGSGSWECDTGGFYGYAEAYSGMRVAIDAAMEKKE